MTSANIKFVSTEPLEQWQCDMCKLYMYIVPGTEENCMFLKCTKQHVFCAKCMSSMTNCRLCKVSMKDRIRELEMRNQELERELKRMRSNSGGGQPIDPPHPRDRLTAATIPVSK